MRKTIVIAALAGLIATACGGSSNSSGDGGSTPSDPSAILVAAPGKAVDAGTAKMEMTITSSFGETSVSFGGTGAIDFTNNRGSFTFDLSSLLSSFGAPQPPAGTDLSLEMRFTADQVYMRLPPEAQTEKPWIAFDLAKLAGVDSANMFSGSDPKQLFDTLKGVTGQVRVEGSATVRGVATTEYSALIDIEKALAAADESQREVLRESLKAFGGSTFPIRVWVGDDDGLVYKQAMTMSAQGADAQVEVEYYAYGEPVDVDLPSTDQVKVLQNEREIAAFMSALSGT